MKIKIDKEFSQLIPPLQPEEFEKLKESIKKEGVREPLTVWNGILLDGHNRLNIANKYKISYKIKELKLSNRTEASLWIINNQLGRRNISPYDRIKLSLKYENILKPIAKEKQSEAGKLKQKSAKASINIRKEIAKIAKVSHNTIDKVKFIEKFANQEQKDRLTKQLDSINKVYLETKKKIITNSNGDKQIKMPSGKFDIIYADPPWKYQFSETTERSIETKYKTMSLEKIKKLDIPISKDSVLFLWATAPKLKEALEVLEAWGFEYKTCAIWDKKIIGMGYWFRGQHEILLVGVKGNIKTPKEKDRVSSVIRIKRTKHSVKPKEIYEIIEKMFPNHKYLELFARNKRKDWESWGDEIENGR